MGYILTAIGVYGLIFFPYYQYQRGFENISAMNLYTLIIWELLSLFPGILLLVYYHQNKIVVTENKLMTKCLREAKKTGTLSKYRETVNTRKAMCYAGSRFYKTMRIFDSYYLISLIGDMAIAAYAFYMVRIGRWAFWWVFAFIGLLILDVFLTFRRREPTGALLWIGVFALMMFCGTFLGGNTQTRKRTENSLLDDLVEWEMRSNILEDKRLEPGDKMFAANLVDEGVDSTWIDEFLERAHQRYEENQSYLDS